MDPDLIVEVKTAALVHGMNLYELIEQAARLWLAQRRPGSAGKRARRRGAEAAPGQEDAEAERNEG